MKLAEYSMKNTKIIYFFLAIMLVGGVLSFDKLGKKEDSPFVIKQAVIVTQFPGATPSEVENLVTEPIEREVQSMRRVYKITSESFFGLSKISVELEPSTPAEEIPQMWDELRRKVLNIQTQLPQGVSVPTVSDDFGDVFGIYYALTADNGFSFDELRSWSQKLKTEISTVPGVIKVALYGEQTEIINVSISTAKLVNMGISPTQIASVLRLQNAIVSSGDKQAGNMQLKIVADGTYKSIDDIRNQLITSPQTNLQFRLGDIATIEKGYMDPPSKIMRVNGKNAIGVGISTSPEKDVVKTGELVKDKLETVLPMIPIGMELLPLYLENEIASDANNGFIINLIESVLIVIMIIMIVMGMRAGLLIGSSLIFSIGGTMLIMQFMEVGLNRTSLAGFIIAMGMLVDNAIVVTDNAQIAMKKGTPKLKALIDGATVPQWGLLGATLIAIFSFLPLYLAPSSVAEMIKPLFIVLAISLTLSWVLALTQTTTFGNLILKAPKEGDKREEPYTSTFYQKFESVLHSFIKRPTATIGTIIVLFAGSLVVMGLMPKNFFPFLEKPYFRADLFLPDGYSLKDAEAKAKEIEAQWLKNPSIKNLSITIGSSPLRYYLASTSFGPKDNFLNVLIELHSSDSVGYWEQEFEKSIRATMPDAVVRSSLFKLSPAVEATIEVGFIGDNVDTLEMLSKKAMEIMKEDPRFTNVRLNWGNKVPVWKPVYSQDKGQLLGISRKSITESLRLETTGLNIGEYRQGDLFMPIMLKDIDIESFNLSNLSSMPVFLQSGKTVPMDQVTDSITLNYEYSVIRRMNRAPLMRAQGDPIRSVNAMALFTDNWKTMQEQIQVPEGYQMKYLGEQESQDDSNAALAANMPLTFMLMFVTLLLLFGAYRKPIVILLMVPLVFIGVVLGLLVMDKQFDFFAMLGLLGLVGMNIKNSIVLVDQIDIELAVGRTQIDAVLYATKSRIIPVLMASGTTILGMLPLLFDSMFGGMAATIMGGLLVASVLTLVILPVSYCAINKIKAE